MFCIYEVAWVLRLKINSKMTSEYFCLANSATTHMILKDKKYFQSLFNIIQSQCQYDIRFIKLNRRLWKSDYHVFKRHKTLY